MPSWDLTPRQICDLELLMNGGFYPAEGLHDRGRLQRRRGKHAHRRRQRCGRCRSRWTSVEKFADKVEPGQDIALRDQEGVILAILSVTDKWVPNKSLRPKRSSAPTTWPIRR
jgi:sulfate adenylyltransferase